MVKWVQRRRINKGAEMINEVNDLYKVGRVKDAEKLKKKLAKNPTPMYWLTQRAKELRVERD